MKAMNIKSLIKRNRSYRRFDQSASITDETLYELIDLARLSASARNQQSLKYILTNTTGLNEKIFPCLGWAGYLKEWDGPEEGERPSAYIVILNDKNISTNHFCDEGIAAQSMLLGAVDKGLGGCMIGTIDKAKLREVLKIPEHLDIIMVLALGKPVETVVIDTMQHNDQKYWRDEHDVHHVPKRSIDEIVITIK